jgi:hypothetical protein
VRAARTVPLAPAAVTAAARGAPIPLGLDPKALGGPGGVLDAIIVRDLPPTATLSAGTYDPAIDGWVVLPRQIAALTVMPSAGVPEDCTLTVLGVSLAGPAAPRLLARIPLRGR